MSFVALQEIDNHVPFEVPFEVPQQKNLLTKRKLASLSMVVVSLCVLGCVVFVANQTNAISRQERLDRVYISQANTYPIEFIVLTTNRCAIRIDNYGSDFHCDIANDGSVTLDPREIFDFYLPFGLRFSALTFDQFNNKFTITLKVDGNRFPDLANTFDLNPVSYPRSYVGQDSRFYITATILSSSTYILGGKKIGSPESGPDPVVTCKEQKYHVLMRTFDAKCLDAVINDAQWSWGGVYFSLSDNSYSVYYRPSSAKNEDRFWIDYQPSPRKDKDLVWIKLKPASEATDQPMTTSDLPTSDQPTSDQPTSDMTRTTEPPTTQSPATQSITATD